MRDEWSVFVDLKRGGVTGLPIFGAEGIGVRISDAVADAVKTICESKRLRDGDFLVVTVNEKIVTDDGDNA